MRLERIERERGARPGVKHTVLAWHIALASW